MGTTNATIRQSVEDSILELIAEFQDAPYTFLFESDLQATLFAKLRSSLLDRVLIPGSGRPREEYELSIVHTEYWKRIDIACIDVEAVTHATQRPCIDSDIHIYELPLLVGIEIKYRKMGDRFGLTACLSDRDKLARLNVSCPIVLGFVQSHSDIGNFLSDPRANVRCVEAADADGLALINVISPKSRWKVQAESGG